MSYQLPSVIMNLCADGVGSVINVVMNFKFLYNTSGVWAVQIHCSCHRYSLVGD